jgi:hypothetical protein
MSEAPASPSLSFSGASIGVKLTAARWTIEPLTVAWSESFLNDRAVNDPFASVGMNPVDAAVKLQLGDIVGTRRGYKSFISASDRYVVVSRDVDRTVFTGTRWDTYSYCAASHPGPERSVTYCSPKYEQRKNPDYREGDYACNGKTLLACIQEAAPTVSRYLYVRVGESCQTYTYHDDICDRIETDTVSYPTYRIDRSTQFVVYRYVDGDFVKLDEQLFQMAHTTRPRAVCPRSPSRASRSRWRGASTTRGTCSSSTDTSTCSPIRGRRCTR